jgi:hypothetical protein
VVLDGHESQKEMVPHWLGILTARMAIAINKYRYLIIFIMDFSKSL